MLSHACTPTHPTLTMRKQKKKVHFVKKKKNLINGVLLYDVNLSVIFLVTWYHLKKWTQYQGDNPISLCLHICRHTVRRRSKMKSIYHTEGFCSPYQLGSFERKKKPHPIYLCKCFQTTFSDYLMSVMESFTSEKWNEKSGHWVFGAK